MGPLPFAGIHAERPCLYQAPAGPLLQVFSISSSWRFNALMDSDQNFSSANLHGHLLFLAVGPRSSATHLRWYDERGSELIQERSPIGDFGVGVRDALEHYETFFEQPCG